MALDSYSVQDLEAALQIARMAWGADSPALKGLLPFLQIARDALDKLGSTPHATRMPTDG
jgi:hypothetical protein